MSYYQKKLLKNIEFRKKINIKKIKYIYNKNYGTINNIFSTI